MAQRRTTSHIVGSMYNFSEAAGQEIITLSRKNSSTNTTCHSNDGNLFFTDASHNNEESLTCLVNSIRHCMSLEHNKEPDVFETAKITRKDGTHPSLALAALIQKGMQAIKPNDELALIEHENIIRRWAAGSENKEVGSKLSLQLLGRIGNLCGCHIEQACDSADLLIKADKEQCIEMGISKLNRLNKMMADEMSFPVIDSFCILEGEISAKLQLIALKDLCDKRSVTTLLRKGSPRKSLQNLCVLVLVNGSNVFQVKLKPTASNQSSPLWNDHVYNCSQAQGLSAAKRLREPENPIGKWISEVTDLDVQVNAFRPQSILEVQQSVKVGIVHKESLPPTKKVIIKRARTARGYSDSSDKAFVESQNDYDVKEATIQEYALSFAGRQWKEDTSTGKENESHRQPPSIEPPYMPPFAVPSHSLSKTPSTASQQLMLSSSTWDVVVRGGKSGNLIDMSVSNKGHAQGNKLEDESSTVIDSLQDNIKNKARDLKYTMRQRKAPTQALIGGDTALVKSFEEATIHLLVLALPRTGRIDFAVEFGRLLISQQCGSSEFRNRSFKASDLSSVFPKGRTAGFEPLFTNMLTARSFEAESIVNVRSSQGRRLFQQQPASRKITYVFSCKAKGGDQMVVEIDENGDFIVHGSEVLIGALDWHFPKRAWDARLRLTSENFITTDYQTQVKGIVDNLKIGVSVDGQTLELCTKAIDENLVIEAIALRRETLHPVTVYTDIILHLTECQDLHVRQPYGTERIYNASVQSPDSMIKANRLWWEAKMSSTNATNILRENSTLEFGEIATWTSSTIINRGVVRDLFAAAKEVVTQIDHVGFYNRDRGSSASKTTGKPSENNQEESSSLERVDPAFW